MLCPKMSSYSPFKTRRRSVRQRCASTGSYQPKRESGNCNSHHAVHFSFSPLAVSQRFFSPPQTVQALFAAFAMRPRETVLEPPFTFASRIDGCRIRTNTTRQTYRADFTFAHWLLCPGGFRVSGWFPRDAHSAFGRLQAQRVMSRSLAQTCDGQLRWTEARLSNAELNSRLNRHCCAHLLSEGLKLGHGDGINQGQSTVAQLDRRLFKGSPPLRAARRIERCYEYVQPTSTGTESSLK
ncbi:hypothetical protein H0G86_007958 [Trichoderma simmonsii]|uniref:Uncharacterized protein n=1 Tax=Trichoderma simmonsii TaxID=1491479 RepID=A0A8G0LJ23_9HYPO|nr:hypothetical protein H0G86_007958 [Trichoderma simmonsii]